MESPVLLRLVPATSNTKIPLAGIVPESAIQSVSSGAVSGLVNSVNFHPIRSTGEPLVFNSSTHSFPLDGLDTNSFIITPEEIAFAALGTKKPLTIKAAIAKTLKTYLFMLTPQRDFV